MEKNEPRSEFENCSDKEIVSYPHLELTINDRIKLEMDRRLKQSIENFNKNSSKQTKWMLILTIIIGILALIQVILLINQI